jgi:hypothetical protein
MANLSEIIPRRGKRGGVGEQGAKGATGAQGPSAPPIGVVIMWHGLLANIPSGWQLCDGTNGTPDLRDKFVRGAANGQNAGGTGGAATHTHDNHAAQGHTGIAVSDHAALTHSGMAVSNHSTCTGTYAAANSYPRSSGYTHSVTQPNQHAAQSHSITQPSDHAAESHSTVNHEPPYYKVVFIRRMT